MKTAKHPLSSQAHGPKITLQRSRRMMPEAGQGSRQAAATSLPMVDQELLLEVLTSFRKGNFTVRMPSNLTGIPGKIADLLNDVHVLDFDHACAEQFGRVRGGLLQVWHHDELLKTIARGNTKEVRKKRAATTR